MKRTYFNSTSFTKLRSFFHKASFLINKHFPPLREVRKTLPGNVGTLHARRVSARRISQNGVLGVLLSGDHKDGSRRVLNRDCRDHEAEETTPLFQFPLLCADWRAVRPCPEGVGGGVDVSSCLAEPF